MIGKLCHEIELKVSASEAWEVIGTLTLARIAGKTLTDIFTRIDVVEGDGSTGTIIQIFLPPGMPGGMTSYKEKFVVVDDKRRVKESDMVEGGYLELGFNYFRVRLEVIEKESESVFSGSIEYEVREEAEANASLVDIQLLVSIMQVAVDYLHNNNPIAMNIQQFH